MTIGLVHFNHLTKKGLTSWPEMRTSSWKPNYGDMLVCAAILRQINVIDGARVSFGERLIEPVDRALIRGSTYLHGNFDFAAANETLDSIKAPVAVIGLGAQNPTTDLHFLDGNAGAAAFISRLNEKAKSISVRGQFSAAVVERLGGKNVRVTGCPSLFYELRCPVVKVSQPISTPRRRVGISIHSGLTDNIFCYSPRLARKRQGELIAWAIKNSARASIFEQGVLEEHDIADPMLDINNRLTAATNVILKLDADHILDPCKLIDIMVSVKSVEEWLRKTRDVDAMLGFRFHGSAVALIHDKPCFIYTYDSRLNEFCELYDLPRQDVESEFDDPVSRILSHDWGKVNERMMHLYNETCAFYRENGFDDRLDLSAKP